MYSSEVEERFWAKVDTSSGGTEACWLWTASVGLNGYGQFFPGGNKRVLAHRFAYCVSVGPIPDGLELDHLCQVRHCVNPAHLEPVTHKENSDRSNSPWGINARKTHCPQGHPYDEANTYVSPAGRRLCRACHREYKRILRSR